MAERIVNTTFRAHDVVGAFFMQVVRGCWAPAFRTPDVVGAFVMQVVREMLGLPHHEHRYRNSGPIENTEMKSQPVVS
jgi:hypothetical protein